MCVLFFRKVSRTENLNGTAQESATDFAFRSFDTSREGHGKPQCKDTCRTHQDTAGHMSYIVLPTSGHAQDMLTVIDLTDYMIYTFFLAAARKYDPSMP